MSDKRPNGMRSNAENILRAICKVTGDDWYKGIHV